MTTADKIRKLIEIAGSRDLSPSDRRFIESLRGFLPPGQVQAMSGPQLKYVNDLFNRHCTTPA